MEAISDRHTVKPVSQVEEAAAVVNMGRMLGPAQTYVHFKILNND
ncbi:hypothetical protein GCM10027019_07670 [Melaminivora jejuensis]